MITTRTLAARTFDTQVGILIANDASKSSFSARAGDSLIALSPDLNVLGRWPVDPELYGHHATRPDEGLALISGWDEVRLIDQTGQARWRYPHPPWRWALESGCTWFDQDGQPYAVIPAEAHDHCLVVRLSRDSGQLLAAESVKAQPSGVIPVHHPDGWVGLDVGEGQDGSQAWWARSAGQAGFEVLAAGWRDWIFADVDRSGSRVITLPHDGGGPFFVLAFPSLEVIRSVDPPPGRAWGFYAFFAGDMIVGTFQGSDEGLVAVSGHGQIEDLDQPRPVNISPVGDGTWLETSEATIRRRTMAYRGESPAQMTLW